MLVNKQHVLQIPGTSKQLQLSESKKRGSESLEVATPNPFRALTYGEAAEASTSMAVSPAKPTKVPNHHPSPAKGSPAEIAFINSSKKAD